MRSITLFTECHKKKKKKNHDAMMQLDKEFGDIITKKRNLRERGGILHTWSFNLAVLEAPMEGMSNIAKIVSIPPKMRRFGWSFLFYRDRKHKEEVGAKMRNDERMGPLWQRTVSLISPGTDFIMGEFDRIKMDEYRLTC